MYIPHGVILDQFLPTAEGADFEYRPIMKPIESFRNQTTLISNLVGPPDGGSGHVGAGAAWLTGASAKRTEAEDVRLGMSVDQHIASQFAPPDAAPLARAHDGRSVRAHRIVRLRLQLHLPQHDLLVYGHDAAADGDQSARGVRAPVR